MPNLKLGTTNQKPQGVLFIGMLASFSSTFAHGTGFTVNNPNTALGLVLMLATRATRAKGLNIKVFTGNTK
jgi:hypothetical protein